MTEMEIYERAWLLLVGKRAGWIVYPHHTGGGVVVCVVDRGPDDPGSVYARVSESEIPPQPFLVGIYRPEDDMEPLSTKEVATPDLERYVFAQLVEAEDGRPRPLANEKELGGRRPSLRRSEDRDEVDALQQIQALAREPIGVNLPGCAEQLRWAQAQLGRIAFVAQAGEADRGREDPPDRTAPPR